VENGKTKKVKKTDTLRSIGKQSGGIRGVSSEEESEGYGGKIRVITHMLVKLLKLLCNVNKHLRQAF